MQETAAVLASKALYEKDLLCAMQFLPCQSWRMCTEKKPFPMSLKVLMKTDLK